MWSDCFGLIKCQIHGIIKKVIIMENKEEKVRNKKEEETEASLADIVKNNYQERTIIENEIPVNKIAIASDHRGFKMKQKLTKYLVKKGYTIIDLGPDVKGSVDYPEFAFALTKTIKNGDAPKGILICGSGIGMSIAANRVKGIRCAKVNNVKEVKYTRKDNDANVIAFSAKMPVYRAKDIVDAFLKTEFSGKARHQKRIDMLDESRG